ncbi:hypothetical protein OPQ81_007549 [Rhizoctonia solani]|nr:hypothetical protein OPQ81_007549 [Rhizoctonia solani]
MPTPQSHRQTLPPIQNLINVANQGMMDQQQHKAPMSEGRTYPVQQQNTTAAGGGTGSRRHVCTECGQAFDRPSSLQTHMNTHTGEQPFQCPYEGCGRKFSVKSNMRRHLSVHEQPRMTDADAEDSRNAHHTNSCEYGVFSVAQPRR